MHKNTVEQIAGWIENWNLHHKDSKDLQFDAFIRSQKTVGFWRMIIIANEERAYLLLHIRSIALAIGGINGEGLWHEISGKYLELS